jgi:hypothetical protein
MNTNICIIKTNGFPCHPYGMNDMYNRGKWKTDEIHTPTIISIHWLREEKLIQSKWMLSNELSRNQSCKAKGQDKYAPHHKPKPSVQPRLIRFSSVDIVLWKQRQDTKEEDGETNLCKMYSDQPTCYHQRTNTKPIYPLIMEYKE